MPLRLLKVMGLWWHGAGSTTPRFQQGLVVSLRSIRVAMLLQPSRTMAPLWHGVNMETVARHPMVLVESLKSIPIPMHLQPLPPMVVWWPGGKESMVARPQLAYRVLLRSFLLQEPSLRSRPMEQLSLGGINILEALYRKV